MTEGGITPRQATMAAIAAGGLAALGSVLPWLEVRTGLGTFTAAGTEGTDGVLTLVIGALAALLAFLALDQPTPNRRLLILVGAVAITGITGYHVLTRGGGQASVAGVDLPTAPGIGLWLTLAAGIVLAVAGWRMPEGEPSPEMAAAQLAVDEEEGRPLAQRLIIAGLFLAGVLVFLFLARVLKP
jgi:hypothetical protein